MFHKRWEMRLFGTIIRNLTHLSACSQRLDQSTGATGRKQTQTPGPIVQGKYQYKSTIFFMILLNKTVYHTTFLYSMIYLQKKKKKR